MGKDPLGKGAGDSVGAGDPTVGAATLGKVEVGVSKPGTVVVGDAMLDSVASVAVNRGKEVVIELLWVTTPVINPDFVELDNEVSEPRGSSSAMVLISKASESQWLLQM